MTLLGFETIEDLRVVASALRNAHYRDDGIVKSVLASSLWMRKDYSYVEETVDRIAQTYYASSYHGEMGSDAYNDALSAWIDQQTGGLLSDQTESIEMDRDTVLAIVTTIYFAVSWSEEAEFSEKENTEEIFHGTKGDSTHTFMNNVVYCDYYGGEQFSSILLPFSEGRGMYLILPDEGVDPETLMSDDEAMEFILTGGSRKRYEKRMAHLSLPRFDVSSQLDLVEGLKNLGLSDIFNSEVSDFTNLTEASDLLEVSEVQHGARVAIDEKGCVAAAYTKALILEESAPSGDRLDFVLDRPFLFVITSEVGLPLFVGIVNDLE